LNETGTNILNRVAQFFVGGSFLRYTLLILAVLLAYGLSWISFVRSDEPFYRGDAPFIAYLIASSIWIVLAILERRRLIWRLLLIWAPEALPIAVLINVFMAGDNTGLAYVGAGMFAFGFGTACLTASIVAFLYRPGEGLLRPPQ
jgi:hypothetical protein